MDAAEQNRPGPVAQTARGQGFFRSRPWRFFRAALIAYLVILLVAMSLEDTLLFFPDKYPSGQWQPAGFLFEDAWFASADGTRLHGWYVPCPDAQAIILFCHGNAGNITHRAHVAEALRRRAGAAVLLFDYRGYGRSEGRPTGKGILADARAARAWLAQRENVPEAEIVLMGESIGGAVAVDLAARDGAKALILESTFDNLPAVAAGHYPWLPVRWLMRTRLDSAKLIGDYHGPLLQTHGDADTIVPLEHGRRLFAAANEPKQFLLLSGHDHNTPLPPAYYNALGKFLGEVGRETSHP